MTEDHQLPTMDEFSETLSGFDEIAIEKAFKTDDWTKLPPMKLLRALKFVMIRREGVPDADAYDQVQGLALGEVNGSFAEEISDEQLDRLADLLAKNKLKPSEARELARLQELERTTIQQRIASGKDGALPA